MVKSIAEKHGLRATFMPKPFLEPHRQRLPRPCLAVGRRPASNLFDDAKGELGLSRTGLPFHRRRDASAPRRCARITNPTVNSYKRINAPRTLSGATWSPNTITYTGNNRTHMIRIPDAGPLRAPPRRRRGQSLSAAGGASSRRASTASTTSATRASASTSTCTPRATRSKGAKRLPLNLLDALRAFDQSAVLREGLGDEFVERLPEAQIRRLERLLPPSHRMGARDDARLLGPQKLRDRVAGRNCR